LGRTQVFVWVTESQCGWEDIAETERPTTLITDVNVEKETGRYWN